LLNIARLRIELREFLLSSRDNPLVVIEYNRPGTGGSLINRQNITSVLRETGGDPKPLKKSKYVYMTIEYPI
jgi:hypothetical protein